MNEESSSPIILAARQAGSASALAPVGYRLRRHGHAVLLFAYPAAAAIMQAGGIECLEVDSFGDALTYLERDIHPQLVITGTSEMAEDDAQWWAWAASRQAPSVGFVDHWANAANRFEGGVPDTAAVASETIGRMLRGILPPSRVRMTGNPATDLLWNPDQSSVIAARRALLPEGRGVLIVIASEPTLNRGGGDRTVRELTRHIYELVRGSARSPEAPVAIAVRPHPRESHSDFAWCATVGQGDVRLAVVERVPLLHAADLLVGFESTMLYEARAVGASVVAVADGEAASVLSGDYEVDCVSSIPEVDGLVERAIASARWPRRISPPAWASPGATDRFIDAVYSR